jgi:phosphate transport system permease protein
VVAAGAGTVALLGALVLNLVWAGWGSIARFGPLFLVDQRWDPVHDAYGALPGIVGTLETSALALLFAVPVAIGVALFLTEFAPRRWRRPISTVVDLSAAVPSVVWGFWAILVVAPWMGGTVEPALARASGGIGPFAQATTGFDVLTASMVLAIMILPTIAALSRSALEAVPRSQREAALALGATRSESAGLAVLRAARPGIAAGVLIGFARAAGEAIIVVSLIGNIYGVPTSLFSQGQTIAGEILNNLNSGSLSERSALVELGLILLVLTLAVQLAARLLARVLARPPSRRPRIAPSRAPSRFPAEASGSEPPSGSPGATLGGSPARSFGVRRLRFATAFALSAGATLLATVPLASVAWTAVARGGAAVVRLSFYTSELPPACPAISRAACPIGGIGPAIQGSALLLLLASAIAVPVGLLVGIYLAEYGRGRATATVRTSTELLLGVPSVLLGLFVVVVLLEAAPSLDDTTLAGAAALSLLMVPIIARASEEALRTVPASAREAALALGFPRHRTTWRIVLPSARGGLVTGVFLAVARAGGETAAIVLTAFGSPFWFAGLTHPISALSIVIFEQGAQSSYPNWQSDAWGAALVLLLLMLSVSAVVHYVVRGRTPSEGGT